MTVSSSLASQGEIMCLIHAVRAITAHIGGKKKQGEKDAVGEGRRRRRRSGKVSEVGTQALFPCMLQFQPSS